MKNNISLSIEEAQRLQDNIKALKKENDEQKETIKLLGNVLNRVCNDKAYWRKAILLVVNQKTKLLELPGLSATEVRPIDVNVNRGLHDIYPRAEYMNEENNITACFERIGLADITDHCFLIDGNFYKIEYTNHGSLNLRTIQDLLKQGDDENG